MCYSHSFIIKTQFIKTQDTNMLIAKNKVVSLQYELYDDANELIDNPEEPLSYLHGGYDGIFPLVEEQLQGKQVGDQIDVTMQAEEAFISSGLITILSEEV